MKLFRLVYRVKITVAVLLLIGSGSYAYGWKQGSRIGVDVTVNSIHRTFSAGHKLIFGGRLYFCAPAEKL